LPAFGGNAPILISSSAHISMRARRRRTGQGDAYKPEHFGQGRGQRPYRARIERIIGLADLCVYLFESLQEAGQGTGG
jgi:hypothetical protein